MTKSTKDYTESLNIKEIMMPVVMFARIYALKHKLNETNTIDRIEELKNRKLISNEQMNEFLTAYNYLMLIRFKHHVQLISINRTPNNFIDLEKLTDIDKSMLKKIFKTISDFQKRLNSDFSINSGQIKR
jgi:CBS domain-containing protein